MATTHPQARAGTQAWLQLRAVLVTAWLALAVTALVGGARPATLDDLNRALAAGRTTTVVVAGQPGGGTGYADQEVRWRDGVVGRWTRVVVESPGSDLPTPTGETVVQTEVGARVAADHTGVRVVRDTFFGSAVHVGGWRLPGWTFPAVLVVGLATVVLLVGGPQPWRATRWAWFWLLGSPWTLLAFLVLSGPAPLLPAPRDPARRLTGGWAFLLAVLVGLLPLAG